MIEQAKLFLKSADTNRAAADMAEMKMQMEAMRAELREAKDALILTVDDGNDDTPEGEGFVPAPPRRGRPSKAEIAARQQGEAA